MVRTKFSRVLSAKRPSVRSCPRSQRRGRKSRWFPLLLESSKHRIDGRNVLDVARQDDVGLGLLGQRLHPLHQGVALIGEGELGAVVAQHLGDAQAMEWSLATPMIRPRFPSINPGMRQLPNCLVKLNQASTCLSTIEALVPPKPNEFDSTAPSFTLSLRSRKIGMSAKAGSMF